MFDGLRKRFKAAVKAWYEGGFPILTGERSWVPALIQDARFDAGSVTRRELMRKARYFEQNNFLVNRAADLWEQYVIGVNGLQLQPTSSDTEWNKRCKEAWEDWCCEADWMGVCDLSELQKIGSRLEFVDGECFFIKTRQKTPRGSVPRIHLVESHRCETPPKLWDKEGSTIVDGVTVDADGRTLSFWLRQGFDFSAYGEFPATNVMHVGEASRAAQYRYLTWMYPVMNALHDLDDLILLEMRAAKDQAEKSTVFNTQTGEMPTAQELLKKKLISPPGRTTTDADVESLEKRVEYYKQALGGRAIALRIGETVTPLAPNRPSQATLNLWDMLVSAYCAGIGIPKVLMLSEFLGKAQGTIARSDLDVAAQFFRARSRPWARMTYETYLYWVEWAKYNDLRVADPPADYKRAQIHPPRSVNVDVGYNMDAALKGIAAGCGDLDSEFYGPRGMDWRAGLDRLKEQQDYAKSIGLNITFGGQPAASAMPEGQEKADSQEEPETQEQPEEATNA